MGDWQPVTADQPPRDVLVWALGLHRFTNAEWQWVPGLYRRTESGWSDRAHAVAAPELWSPIVVPELPDTPERRRALHYAALSAERRRQHDEIDRRFSEQVRQETK